MGKIRKRHSAEFKARVALEAIQGVEPVNIIASRHGINPNLLSRWKQEAVTGLVGVFNGSIKTPEQAHEEDIKRLERKVGQLTMERDFLVEARRKLGLPISRG